MKQHFLLGRRSATTQIRTRAAADSDGFKLLLRGPLQPLNLNPPAAAASSGAAEAEEEGGGHEVERRHRREVPLAEAQGLPRSGVICVRVATPTPHYCCSSGA